MRIWEDCFTIKSGNITSCLYADGNDPEEKEKVMMQRKEGEHKGKDLCR